MKAGKLVGVGTGGWIWRAGESLLVGVGARARGQVWRAGAPCWLGRGTGLESWRVPAVVVGAGAGSGDRSGELDHPVGVDGWGGGSRVSLHCYIHRSQNKRLKGNDSSATVCVPPDNAWRAKRQPQILCSWDQITTGTWREQSGGPASRCLSLGTRCKGSFLRCSFQLRSIPLLTTPSHQVSSQPYRTHLWLPSRVHAQGLALSVQTLRAQDSNSGLRTQAQGSLRVQS